MRRLIVAVLTLIGPTTIASQLPPADAWVRLGYPNTTSPAIAVAAVRTQFYLGGPSAEIPARGFAPGSLVRAKSFLLRAWKEGDKARVVIYAVMIDDRAPRKETETPIATFAIAIGQSVEVSETEQWGRGTSDRQYRQAVIGADSAVVLTNCGRLRVTR